MAVVSRKTATEAISVWLGATSVMAILALTIWTIVAPH